MTGDLRLAGGSVSSGRVEVCVYGIWGTVADNFWDARDAKVACGQLGFSRKCKCIQTPINYHCRLISNDEPELRWQLKSVKKSYCSSSSLLYILHFNCILTITFTHVH